MRERDFQAKLIKEIKERFPGCIVMKNDSSYIQGIPDLTVLYGDTWAGLECKNKATAKHQANQDFYVEKMNGMAYATFVCPENKDDILGEMEDYFDTRHRRMARY